MVIWKLVIRDEVATQPFILKHSVGGKVLTVDVKDGEISVWYMTDKKLPQNIEADIRLIMTGEEADPSWRYINTFTKFKNNFNFVLHAFQVV
jgi:hypothetical protein